MTQDVTVARTGSEHDLPFSFVLKRLVRQSPGSDGYKSRDIRFCGVKPHAKVSKQTKRIAPSSRRRIRQVPPLACGRGVTRRLSAIVGDSQPARHE